MTGPLVAATERAFHRRDVDNVGPSRARRRQRATQSADEDERRRLVAELHLEQLDWVDILNVSAPAVVGVEVRHEPPGVDRTAGCDPLGRGCADAERERAQGL